MMPLRFAIRLSADWLSSADVSLSIATISFFRFRHAIAFLPLFNIITAFSCLHYKRPLQMPLPDIDSFSLTLAWSMIFAAGLR